MRYANYYEKIQNAAKLSEEKKTQDAIKEYFDAIELAPKEEDKLEPLYALGLEFKEENPDDALIYLEQCSKLAKEFDTDSFYYCYHYNAEREIGEIFMEQKRFPKALLHFKKAYKDIKKYDDDKESEKYLNKVIKVMEKKGA